MALLLNRSVLVQVLFAGVTVFLQEFLLLILTLQSGINDNTNRHYSLAISSTEQ